MKDGYIVKDVTYGSPTEEELKSINLHTRREFKADEVYVFTVILCDNEIDREFERFTKNALIKLSELFVGKTGILDHNMKSENQTGRRFCRPILTSNPSISLFTVHFSLFQGGRTILLPSFVSVRPPAPWPFVPGRVFSHPPWG